MPKKLSEDLYALLGTHAGVDAEQLRQVWRTLARRFHPDRAGLQATAMFQTLSAAYQVLSDPVARAAYDRRRRAAMPAAVPSGSPRRAPSSMISRACGPLSSLLACGVARRADDGIIDLFLNAAEVAQGGMVTISMRVPVRKAEIVVEELFSAWLTVYPGVADGAILTPSVSLPGMIQAVRFRIRVQSNTTRTHRPPEATAPSGGQSDGSARTRGWVQREPRL